MAETVGRLLSRKEFIARARHLVWMGYQIAVGQDYNMKPTPDQMASLLDGVAFMDEHPDATPRENHENWMKMKESQGWVYGPRKDMRAKTHPDLVPFEDLPEVERYKDVMDAIGHKAAVMLYDDLIALHGITVTFTVDTEPIIERIDGYIERLYREHGIKVEEDDDNPCKD